MSIFLIILLTIIAIIDIKTFKILNIMVYPAILVGVLYTGFFLQTISAFIVMALLLKDKEKQWGLLRWSGGDVKLFLLIAAFKGWLFLPAIIGTELLIRLYRLKFNHHNVLPVAPFALSSTMAIMLIAVALK